jgi:chemosensory pili system protein ChpA (sensor histidine kinase/response regulator)
MSHILIAEDDKEIRDEVALLLQREGFTITQAANGVEAARHLKSGGPRIDLVVLDLMMPERSGWELLVELRAQSFLARVPVVITSALAAPPQRLGAQAYLQKPFDPGTLVKTIRSLLASSSAPSSRPSSVPPFPSGSTQRSSPAPRRVRVLVAEDDDDIRDGLVELLRSHNIETRSARDGLEALEVLHTSDNRVDVLVLDLMMPRCSGWELLTQLRTEDALARMPVLIVSALAQPPQGLDVQGYLQKPFQGRALLEAVQRLAAERQVAA